MNFRQPTFRLYLLGGGKESAAPRRLVSFAEFDGWRAVEHLQINDRQYDNLLTEIRLLRGFIEANHPQDYEESALESLGGELFNLVIVGDVERLMNQATGWLKGQSSNKLPLELFVENPQIASLPWEYLYNAGTEEFICKDFHPISRGIFSYDLKKKLPPVEGRIRILILLGVLPDDKNTSPEDEIKNIKNVFSAALAEESVEIDVLDKVTPEMLRNKLAGGSFDIIHFFGHGRFDAARQQGYLQFELSKEQSISYYARDFAANLQSWGENIRLVFLNACESGRASETESAARSSIAAALLKRGISAVIANQFSIPATNAHFFSALIYDNLALGKTLGEVMSDARISNLLDRHEKFTHWGIPVLYASDPELSLFPLPVKNRLNDFGKVKLVSRIKNMAEEIEHASENLQPEDLSEEFHKNLADVFIIDHKGNVQTTAEGKIVKTSAWMPVFDRAIHSDNLCKNLNRAVGNGNPSVTLEQTLLPVKKKKAKVRVALVDFDAKAGFLPEVVQAANKIQSYYNFQVSYLPIPSGAIQSEIGGERTAPQIFIPNLEDYLKTKPGDLDVDKICCLTSNLVAGEEEDGELYWNFFTSHLVSNPDVLIVSTYGMREYAREADVSFAEAVFRLCVSILVAMDARWNIQFHAETVGCPFDFCENRRDIVTSLRKTTFDHASCRSLIKDKQQLRAIDALMSLKADFN